MNSRRRLPSLNALRAFDAVARHLSFVEAADELAVTPAAVSHQIRLLEEHIGLPLFERGARSLTLTDAGLAGLPDIRHAFERLAAGIDAINSLGETGVLNISVAPSFAAKWLLPRLDRFQTRHAEIDVRVEASMRLSDFAKEGVDLTIRYGAGAYPGLEVERLLPESVIAVCSPALLAGSAPRSARDLAGCTLLHDDSPDNDVSCPTWEMWFRAAGASDVDATRGPRFTQSSLVLEAAVLGRGVALAKAVLAADDLARGTLVRVFDAAVPVNFAYYLVAPKAKLNLPKVSHFYDWLRDEIAASGSADGGEAAVAHNDKNPPQGMVETSKRQTMRVVAGRQFRGDALAVRPVASAR